MGALDRLKAGLSRTRPSSRRPLEDLVRGRRPLDAGDLDAVEEALIAADLGLPAVAEAMEVLRARSGEIAGGGAAAMREVLRDEVRGALDAAPRVASPSRASPGSSSWSASTARARRRPRQAGPGLDARRHDLPALRRRHLPRRGRRAARDLGGAHGEPLPSRRRGGRSGAVLTDALRTARARGHDAVLVDTAGRLHTKGNLMAELAKMARVAGKEVPGAPHETLLVLDATVGSNGLAQGREFAKAAGVTGLVLTKLDGTAKGGVAVAVVRELGVPIRYVGVGEIGRGPPALRRRRLRRRPGRVTDLPTVCLPKGCSASMRRALAPGGAGLGRDEPEPVVGCVIVRKGRVVGEGWHAGPAGRTPRVLALGRAGVAGPRGHPLREPRAVRPPGSGRRPALPRVAGRRRAAGGGGDARPEPARERPRARACCAAPGSR